jgi:glutaredoxin 2
MFCSRVINVIKCLNIDIDGKNIWQDRDALQELELATGRATVPVLRIETADGEVTWMPESNDIVRYLSICSTKERN